MSRSRQPNGPGRSPAPHRIVLPVNNGTNEALDLHRQLLLVADTGAAIEIDASAVEAVGQATLQLLVAAHRQRDGCAQRFKLVGASDAFIDRVRRCRLADAVGLSRELEVAA